MRDKDQIRAHRPCGSWTMSRLGLWASNRRSAARCRRAEVISALTPAKERRDVRLKTHSDVHADPRSDAGGRTVARSAAVDRAVS
jgi:hypothetical protein